MAPDCYVVPSSVNLLLALALNLCLPLQVACMQFINIVVHSVENMNFRVFLQYEFTHLGLDEYLEVSLICYPLWLALQTQGAWIYLHWCNLHRFCTLRENHTRVQSEQTSGCPGAAAAVGTVTLPCH